MRLFRQFLRSWRWALVWCSSRGLSARGAYQRLRPDRVSHGGEIGVFDVSTLKEPYRIEGKKTMGLELAEQRGWRLPDVIVYPTGGA